MGLVRPSRHARPRWGEPTRVRGAAQRSAVAAAVTVVRSVGKSAAMPAIKSAQARRGSAPQTAKATQDDAAGSPTQSIVALVNDEPITGYEIEQRVALAMLGAPDVQRKLQAKLKAPSMNEQFKAFAMKRLQANPPKSEAEQQARVKQLQGEFVEQPKAQIEKEYVPTARKQALDELIDERLKLQEAKKLSVVTGDDEVERVISGMAERNKMTSAQFAEHMTKMGANIAAMRERIRASLSWADVIRRKFGHQITVANRDVDRMVATVRGPGRRRAQDPPHPLVAAAQSGSEASRPAHRATQSSCAKSSPAARVWRRWRAAFPAHASTTSAIAARRACRNRRASLLLSAHDDELLPATIGENGVELWAVCGRKLVKAADAKRETAQNELRQKEFEILSKKHLKDLRTDAHIEFR